MIDAHVHLLDPSKRSYPWMTGEYGVLARTIGPDELDAVTAASGVSGAIVVHAEQTESETVDLLALAASARCMLGVVGWVDLTADDVSERIARLVDLGHGRLVGVRHLAQDEPDPAWLERADVRRGIRAVAACGLVYDVLVRAPQITAAVSTVKALPDVRFVLDHCGKPIVGADAWEPWAGHIEEIAACENVMVKLSGLVTEGEPGVSSELRARYGSFVLDRFGIQRTMFGSDWPVCTVRATYVEVMDLAMSCTADLNADEQAGVYGANAQRWYGLGSR